MDYHLNNIDCHCKKDEYHFNSSINGFNISFTQTKITLKWVQ